MNGQRAVVFANGDYQIANSVRANVREDDLLVCVDGGVQHCLDSEFTPDLLVGDLDSLDHAVAVEIERLGTRCIRYPAEKDASDLELALDLLCEQSVTEAVLLGISGGRTDHSLFNWQLAASRAWPFKLRLIDDYVDAQLVEPARAVDRKFPLGCTFSVLPLAGTAKGVMVQGAKYPLNNATLTIGSTLGLSNVVTASRLQVSVEEGVVLFMQVIKEKQSCLQNFC